jgi:hypothetical protein
MAGDPMAHFWPWELVWVLGGREAILRVNHGGRLIADLLDNVIAGMADDQAPIDPTVAFRNLDAGFPAQSHLGDRAGFQEGLLPRFERGGLEGVLEIEWLRHKHLRKFRLWGCSAGAAALYL